MSRSRPYRTRRVTGPVLLVLVWLLAAAPATAAAVSPPGAPAGPREETVLYRPVLPELRAEIAAETADDLSVYRIDATFTPAAGDERATISGTLDLRYVNQTGAAQDALYFRLYPNGREYLEGGLTVADVRVAGEAVEPTRSVGETLLTVPLPRPVGIGAAVDLRLDFLTVVPTDPVSSYGMFSFDPATGTYALAHWLPLLAGYDAEGGWLTEQPSELGDPVFTNTALFDVTLTSPASLVWVTTGSRIAEEPVGELIRHRFVSGPVRDFVMAADEDYLAVSEVVEGTTVTSYFNPGNAAGGEAALRIGVQSLALFNRLFGPYPYLELDLVEVDLGNGAGGIEFPQLTFIGSDYYDEPGDGRAPTYLDFIVAHEVAHQWWYALVGNNQYLHAFLDEGLSNYATVVYLDEVYGEQIARRQLRLQLELPYLSLLCTLGDQVADQPTDAFPSLDTYGATVYGKAALGFAAIHDAIGDEAFFGGLRAYAAEGRFGVAGPEQLRAALERGAGRDLSDLWARWFEQTAGREDLAEDLPAGC